MTPKSWSSCLKIVAFEERVVDDGKECLAPELLQHRPAQERFAGADLAGDDDQRLAAIERMAELSERRRERRAREQESSVGSNAERRLVQPEKRFVPLEAIGFSKCGHGTNSTHRDRKVRGCF